MATGGWTPEDLNNALLLVEEKGASIRAASREYGIPKSTLHDHCTGKAKRFVRGPTPYLTPAEEQQLADWAVQMGRICYGRTKEQISSAVKKLLDRDGRQNPFVDNRPGKDWWYAFLRRHPELTMRSPEHLQLARASACSKEVLSKWYVAFKQFVELNGVSDPARVWNADETGCPLCPKSGKVLALSGTKDVYQATSNSKEQITTLCAISAAGNTIPPMHIFSGQRFHYNPLEGCVSGAYFGKSDKGWMTRELFYGWLANHFILCIPPGRPVILLVDGHSTHIDIEISKFCDKNGVLLYCLPAHSSHITQPLDVGFYGPLKQAWKKAAVEYSSNNIGKSVTKQTFSRVFKGAWENTVKASTIVNSFRTAGIFPVDFSAIRQEKLAPATVYTTETAPELGHVSEVATKPESEVPSEVGQGPVPGSAQVQKASEVALEAFEGTLDEETRERYTVRFEEGYDLEIDELYTVWMKLKSLSINEKSTESQHGHFEDTSLRDKHSRQLRSRAQSKAAENGQRQKEQQQKEAAPATRLSQPEEKKQKGMQSRTSQLCGWGDILQYPKAVPCKKKRAGTSDFPAHISSSQMIDYLRQKEEKKQAEEEAKRKRKEDRELKKQQREAEKERKAKGRRGQRQTRRKATSTRSQSDDPSEDEVICPACSSGSDHRDGWVCCDVCDSWFHKNCTNIPSDEYDDLSDIDWYCSSCTL